ncbi:MAG: DUF5814 domain-containing protein [Methanomicrobiales archaeon]|jgi:hypothetical protein|nr:DUF5814 domain-containing protein [Methanomicrobiales archaeon]
MFPAKAKLVYAKKLGTLVRYRVPDGAFHGAVLELLASGTGLDQLDGRSREQYLSFFRAFITKCSCKTRPFCGCPERLFIREVIELRQNGFTHKDIADYLLDEYGIVLYPTDILSFLEESVHVLEAIHRVSMLSDRPSVEASAADHIRSIEGRDIEYIQKSIRQEKKSEKPREKGKKGGKGGKTSLSVQDLAAFSGFEQPKGIKHKKSQPERVLQDDTLPSPVHQGKKKRKKKKKSADQAQLSSPSSKKSQGTQAIDAAEYASQTSRATIQKKERRVRSITLPPTKDLK